MRKILAFTSALGFLSTATLNVTACGISDGQKVNIEVPNAPKKATAGEDPTVQYVFNDKYFYSPTGTNLVMGVIGQLMVDKIKIEKYTTDIWPDFYKSDDWKKGFFSSITYDQASSLPSGEHDFSFSGKANNDFFMGVKNNDASVDNNKIRVYWFVTSEKAWAPSGNDYQPTKENIAVPNVNDFSDTVKTITNKGWIHIYSNIGKFKIDCSAQIDFNFVKSLDKNNVPIVLLSSDTFNFPLGKIDFQHPENSFDRIANLTLTEQT